MEAEGFPSPKPFGICVCIGRILDRIDGLWVLDLLVKSMGKNDSYQSLQAIDSNKFSFPESHVDMSFLFISAIFYSLSENS
jgi:hypothetical protein